MVFALMEDDLAWRPESIVDSLPKVANHTFQPFGVREVRRDVSASS